MDRPGRNTNSRRNHVTVERLKFVFIAFVVAAGFHHLGLLREHLNTNDLLHSRVRDEPGISGTDPNFRRETEETTISSPKTKTTKTETGPRVTLTVTEYLKILEDNAAQSESTSESAEEEDVAELTPEEKETQEKEEKEKQEKERKEKEKLKEFNKRYEEELRKCPDKKEKQLNVALFYADDWTMKVLGKLDKRVKTPNIDAMADKGMIFTNNCVTTSVCWASRATLATGTYVAIHKHNMPFDEVEFEAEVWPDTLYPLMKKGSSTGACKNGYYTGLFGKWHKLEIQDELKASFHQRKIYYGNHWEERDGKMQHVTELNKIDSIEFLDKWRKKFGDSAKKPFFLTTSFFATHALDGEFPSYEPQNSTRLNVYPDSIHIEPPKTATEEHYQRLPHFLRVEGGNEGRTRWMKRFEPDFFQKNIKDIYAMATEVDEAVGAIIEKIKSLGEYDNTVLIFTTDNGNLHGEHGLAEKWYPFEESMRVPLVIQDPRMPQERRGSRSDAWTLNVDLTTTILGVANIPPSDFMQGRDISDLYLNENTDQESLSVDEMKEAVKWRKDWFYEFNLGQKNDGSDHPWYSYIDAAFALVNDEWKYVYWPQHNYEQLFHRSVDPYDEWDLLDKIFRSKTEKENMDINSNTQVRRASSIDNNKIGCCDTLQTTQEMYTEMKMRYAVLKERAQSGERI